MGRVIVVRHEIETPALYGAAAALVAAREGGQVFWPTSQFDVARHPDAIQHVTEDRALIPSGLIWADRVTDVPARPLTELAGNEVAVVPLHRAFLSDYGAIDRLLAAGAEECLVNVYGDRFVDEAGVVIGWRDRFGRVMLEQPRHSVGSGPVLGLVGPEAQFLDVCPAPLAALGDALEQEAPGGEVRFLDPRRLSSVSLRGLDGLMLPGGSDMSLVGGQIALVAAARAIGLPVIGICLGMQSMATAVARELPGWSSAEMAEVAPHSVRQSVVQIETGEHRLGPHQTRTLSGSRVEELLGTNTAIIYNHRYRLAPQLHARLETRGIRVSSFGGTQDQEIADAIEAEHGFWIGMQGHPELSSRPGRPHALFRAFVVETRNAPTRRY